jgi:hypothetical protein
MAFRNDRQRKAFFAGLKQKYQGWQHKREVKSEHKLQQETKQTEAELAKEQVHMSKALQFEKQRMQLQKEREELAKLKSERFQMSKTGRFLSATKKYSIAGLHNVQRYTQQPTPRRHKRRTSGDEEYKFDVD